MSGATQNVDGSAKKWKHGRAVVDGIVRYLSVSALEKADSSTGQGCLRRWWFHYIGGLKDPPSPSKDRGDKCHLEVATYLRTGDRSHLSTIVMSGLHIVPTPGPDLLIEQDIVPDAADGKSGLEFAVLRAAGIPLVGAMDLVHHRAENPGVSDFTQMKDDGRVLKFVDWKFPNDLKNAKAPHELAETIQMTGYAKWGFDYFEKKGVTLERARLSHGYMPVRGSARMPTILVTRDRVEQTWKRATAIAVGVRDAAKELDPNKVDANTRACRAYNRDCPAKVAGVCTAASSESISALLGPTAAERFLSAPVVPSGAHQPMNTIINPGSLFAQMQGGTPPAAPAPVMAPVVVAPVQATAPVQFAAPAPAPAAAPPNAAVQAEMARLTAQEAAAAPAQPSGPSDQDVLELVTKIKAFGLGFPKLTGFAAGRVGRLTGRTPRLEGADHALDGEGHLGQYSLSDVGQLPAALEETQRISATIAAAAPQVQNTNPPVAPAAATVAGGHVPATVSVGTSAAVQSILPPDAPASNPAIASAGPAEDIAAKKAAEKQAKEAEKAAEKERKKAEKEAAKQAKAQAAATPSNPPPATIPPQTLEQASGGMYTEVAPGQYLATVNGTVTATPPAPAPAPAPSPSSNEGTPAAPSSSPFVFFVDATVDGLPVQSLWPWLHEVTAWMTKDSGATFSFGGITCADFRAQADGKYSHGKWRGILAGCLMALYEQGKLPPGNYYLDGAMGEIAGAVVETLKEIARRSGGAFVKGVR